ARPLVTGDAQPRDRQHRRVTHPVIQIIETTVTSGDRPTVQFVLNLPYRLVRGLIVRPPGGIGVHRRVFGYDSHLLLLSTAALPHVTGSPGLGVLRRLRPTGTLRLATRLS